MVTVMDLGEYICDRIKGLKEEYGYSLIKMADIMNYDRATLHRILRDKSVPSTERLFQLSVHFGVPMSYWFPAINGGPLPVAYEAEVQRECSEVTKLTKQVVMTIGGLSVVHRKALLSVVENSPELIPTLLNMVEGLKLVDEKTRKKLANAVITLAQEKAMSVA